MRHAPASIGLFLCTLAAAQTPPWVHAREAYERANAFFEEHRLADNTAALNESLAADPNNVPALTLKAKVALGANRPDIARECLEKAVAADPPSWYARFLYGFWYYLRDDWEHAIMELSAAQKLNPRDAGANLYLALTYERLGSLEKATLFARRALNLEESAGKPEPYTLLAYSRLLEQTGKLAECASVLNKAGRLYPESRDVHYEIAQVLLRQGKAKEAAEEGEAALRMHAEEVADSRIHYLLVRAWEAAGDDRRATMHASAIRESEAEKPQ